MSEVVTGDAVVLDVQIAQLPVRAVGALIDITVMFNPEPWKIGPNGYSPFISDPKPYSLISGPATFEMITLWIGVGFSGVRDIRPNTRPNSVRVAICVQSSASVGTMARPCSFAREVLSAIARGRAAIDAHPLYAWMADPRVPLGRRFVFDEHDLFPSLFEQRFGRGPLWRIREATQQLQRRREVTNRLCICRPLRGRRSRPLPIREGFFL